MEFLLVGFRYRSIIDRLLYSLSMTPYATLYISNLILQAFVNKFTNIFTWKEIDRWNAVQNQNFWSSLQVILLEFSLHLILVHCYSSVIYCMHSCWLISNKAYFKVYFKVHKTRTPFLCQSLLLSSSILHDTYIIKSDLCIYSF